MNLPFDLIVIDLETAGDPDQRIVEIGCVRLDNHLEFVSEYSALVDGRPVHPTVLDIHHISENMLDGKPKFREARHDFEAWCKEREPYALCSWSDFDHCTLRDEYRREGLKYPHSGHALDLKAIVWWDALKRGVPSRTLTVDRALSLLGIPFEGERHRALPDARMEARILQQVASQRESVWKLS